MASAAIPRLPAGAPRPRDGWLLFADGAKYLLEKWELLHTAVVEEWGGKGSRAKFDRIVDDLLMNCEEQWRDGHDLHIDTLDVYLLECLEADFNIDFEDDSVVTQVSTLVVELYRKCALGALEEGRALMQRIVEALPTSRPARPRTASDDEDDEDGDEDSDDGGGGGGAAGGGGGGGGRGPHRVIDEDGWETIVPKGAGGKAGGRAPGASAAAGAAPAAAGSGDGSAAGGDGSAAGGGGSAAMEEDR